MMISKGLALIPVVALTALTGALPPQYTLTWSNSSCVKAGDMVTLELSVSDLGSEEAIAFQAFLEFDTTELFFVSGEFPAGAPFQWSIVPVQTESDNLGQLRMAAGLDLLNNPGTPPLSSDALLATMTFITVVDSPRINVNFRNNFTPNKLSEADGDDIIPLLNNSPNLLSCLVSSESPSVRSQDKERHTIDGVLWLDLMTMRFLPTLPPFIRTLHSWQ